MLHKLLFTKIFSEKAVYSSIRKILSGNYCIEIAKIAARESSFPFLENLSNYLIYNNDEVVMMQLIKMVWDEDDFKIPQHIALSPSAQNLIKAYRAVNLPLNEALPKTVPPHLHDFNVDPEFKNIIEGISSEIAQAADPKHKRRLEDKKTRYLLLIAALTAQKTFLKKDSLPKGLAKLITYGNLDIAKVFSFYFLDHSKDEEYLKYYNKVIGEKAIYLCFPMTILAQWWISGNKEEQDTIEKIINLLKAKRKSLKDGMSGLEQALLQTLLVLENSEFTLKEKTELLLLVTGFKDKTNDSMLSYLRMLQTMVVFKERRIENKMPKIKTLDEFKEYYKTSIESCFGFKIDKIERYLELNQRVPCALETYMNGMKGYKDGPVQKAASEFIRSLLEKEFQTKRYVKAGHPHLKLIPEAILELWKVGVKKPLGETRSIENSDDWQDLFLSGTEVPGSCLQISGRYSLNKCLLGLVMDGKNRVLVIKNEKGKIVARRILRLLLDSNGHSVLFSEKTYGSMQYEEAFDQFEKEDAKRMGVDLYRFVDGASEGGETLYSKGSNAPFEYSDAAGNGVNQGVFSINGIKVKLS